MTCTADRTAAMALRCASNTSRDRLGASRIRTVAWTKPHAGRSLPHWPVRRLGAGAVTRPSARSCPVTAPNLGAPRASVRSTNKTITMVLRKHTGFIHLPRTANGLPVLPNAPWPQQPEHWSGVFNVMSEFRRMTMAGGAENRPPPCTLMPWLPASELRVTVVCCRVSWTGGPVTSVAFQIPPPWAAPAGPVAVPELPLTASSISVSRPPLNTPTPWTSADPVLLRAVAVFPVMALSRTVSRLSLPNMAKAPLTPAALCGLSIEEKLPEIRVLLIVPPPSTSSALPEEPTPSEWAASVIARLPETTPPDMSSEPAVTFRPASIASPAPFGVVAMAVFFEITVFSTVVVGVRPATSTPPVLATRFWTWPPNTAGRLVLRLAVLPEITLSVMTSTSRPESPPGSKSGTPAQMPPPSAKRPAGLVAVARLPDTIAWSSVRLPWRLKIPPPSASLVVPGCPGAAPVLLPITTVRISVSAPQLSMPPPLAGANGHCPCGKLPGQLIPEGTLVLGLARLPEITLSEMVTVAPSARLAPGGISMPPPAAQAPALPSSGTDTALDRASPPVIVTPLIEPVGSLAAP